MKARKLEPATPMRTITLEEHFSTPGLYRRAPAASARSRPTKSAAGLPISSTEFADVGDRRLAEMDAAGIDMQVLSLTRPASNNWMPPRRWR